MSNSLKYKMFAGVVLGAGFFVSGPALASYMSNCNELIANWETCVAAGESDCKAEEQRIIDECRCHEKRRDEWVFARGAPGSNVCLAEDPPEDLVPPPPPPPPPTQIREREERGGNGGEERGNGDEERGGGRH